MHFPKRFFTMSIRRQPYYRYNAGKFSGRSSGKMQFGSGWWHLDQRDGMNEQLKTLANVGLLSRFVGMLTDSRSFLHFQGTNISQDSLQSSGGMDARRLCSQ